MNFNYNSLYEADIPIENSMEDIIDVQKALGMLTEEESQLLSMAQYLTSKEMDTYCHKPILATETE